jgi:hypothetical protein
MLTSYFTTESLSARKKNSPTIAAKREQAEFVWLIGYAVPGGSSRYLSGS